MAYIVLVLRFHVDCDSDSVQQNIDPKQGPATIRDQGDCVEAEGDRGVCSQCIQRSTSVVFTLPPYLIIHM
jgi:hypothetical protein